LIDLRQTKHKTRCQDFARIADRTAPQHLWGHMMSSVTRPFDGTYAISYWWSYGTMPVSLTVSETFDVDVAQWLT